MNATLSIDKAGRLVLPKPVREQLQLAAGDTLELESSDDRIVLRPSRGTGSMRREKGIWVLRTGRPLSPDVVNRTRHQIRNERSTAASNSLSLARNKRGKNS